MPTNDERREVAKKLRENAESNPRMGLLLNVAFADGSLRPEGSFEWEVSSHDAALRLANLIEPEPERTCRIYDTDHGFEYSIRCDACQMTFRRPWQPFKFCPNCGAGVVPNE